jgi:hypothetical protein
MYKQTNFYNTKGGISKPLPEGETREAGGWRNATKAPKEVRHILRANKMAKEFCGTSKLRKRKPMLIHIGLPQDNRAALHYAQYRARGDTQRFMLTLFDYKGYNPEAGELAEKLGWSRDMVLIYKARLERKGLVQSTRQENSINNY